MPRRSFGRGVEMCAGCPGRGNICGSLDRGNSTFVIESNTERVGDAIRVQAQGYFEDRDGAHSNGVALEERLPQVLGRERFNAAMEPRAFNGFLLPRIARCEEPGIVVVQNGITDSRGGTTNADKVLPWCPAYNNETFALALRANARLMLSGLVIVSVEGAAPAVVPSGEET